MFQPCMVIIRLTHKKENRNTVTFRIDLSVLNITICIKCILYMSSWIALGTMLVKVAMYKVWKL